MKATGENGDSSNIPVSSGLGKMVVNTAEAPSVATTSSKDVQLQLHFLGKRPYLQGSTLFDALCKYVPEKAKLTLKIGKAIRSDRVRVILDGCIGESSSQAFSAFLGWRSVASRGTLAVEALPPSEDPVRKPYDEHAVTDFVAHSGETATFEGKSPFSFAATLTSINKVLVSKLVRSKDDGQWLLTRIDLDYLPSAYSVLTLRLHSVLFGGHMAKSDIITDGHLIGVVYFSWIEPRF